MFRQNMYNIYMNNPSTARILRPLVDKSKMREYKKGQIILYPGDVITSVFIVKKGAILLYDIDDSGTTKVLYILGKNSVFPLMSALDTPGASAAWFYEALEDTELHMIPYADFRECLHKDDGTIHRKLMQDFMDDVFELVTRINSLSNGTSLMKLSGTLKFLAKKHGKTVAGTNWSRVNFPVSHQLLANMTGLTRETITHSIGTIQKADAIHYTRNSRLSINSKKLKKLETLNSK